MMAIYVDITDRLRKKVQCIDVFVRSNVPDLTYEDHQQAVLDQKHESIIFSAKKKRFKNFGLLLSKRDFRHDYKKPLVTDGEEGLNLSDCVANFDPPVGSIEHKFLIRCSL